MPTNKNPLAQLAEHRERMAKGKEREEALRKNACEYLGGLALDAGLGDWNKKDLQAGFASLVEKGPSANRGTKDVAKSAQVAAE